MLRLVFHDGGFRGAMLVVPSFPPGDVRRIYLHWTAGDYATVFPAYHYCVALGPSGVPLVVETCDPRANMRDLRDARACDAAYAAHTANRNSYALGIAICGMAGAVPEAFGAYPLRDEMVAACCDLAAAACAAYALAIDGATVMTHAEAALEDGYFGAAEDERWDIARLVSEKRPLAAEDARRTGETLRARVRECYGARGSSRRA
ncbi:MAG: hypothetical protein NVS2B3_15850 [Vulcanimicrobiaceae bacterium]